MDKLKYIKLENEDGSYSDSIPLAVDANYVNVNGNTLTSELNNKASVASVNSNVNNLQSQINGLASGSPLVASSTSSMTDTSKVYVNTTDGHWYYYDTTWKDGGVYQATELDVDTREKIDTNDLKVRELYGNEILNINDFEKGNITYTTTEWIYANSNTRVRLKQNVDFYLNAGDEIFINNDNIKMYLGWYKEDKDHYLYRGWVTNSIIMPISCKVSLLFSYIEESTINSVQDIIPYITIKRKGRINLTEENITTLGTKSTLMFNNLFEAMGLNINNFDCFDYFLNLPTCVRMAISTPIKLSYPLKISVPEGYNISAQSWTNTITIPENLVQDSGWRSDYLILDPKIYYTICFKRNDGGYLNFPEERNIPIFEKYENDNDVKNTISNISKDGGIEYFNLNDFELGESSIDAVNKIFVYSDAINRIRMKENVTIDLHPGDIIESTDEALKVRVSFINKKGKAYYYQYDLNPSRLIELEIATASLTFWYPNNRSIMSIGDLLKKVRIIRNHSNKEKIDINSYDLEKYNLRNNHFIDLIERMTYLLSEPESYRPSNEPIRYSICETQYFPYDIKVTCSDEFTLAVCTWTEQTTDSDNLIHDSGWSGTSVILPKNTWWTLNIRKVDQSDFHIDDIKPNILFEKIISIDAIESQIEDLIYNKLNTINFNNLTYNYKDSPVKAINHRGYNRVAPENTLPAYKLSKQNGFDIVECDIRTTSDGEIVILHDATVDRTSNGTGQISQMTLAEAKALDFGSWKSAEYTGTTIPTFEEFISLLHDINLSAYVEIEGGAVSPEALETKVDAVVKAYHMEDKITYISNNLYALQVMNRINPKARLGRIVWNQWDNSYMTTLQELKTPFNEVFIDIGSDFITPEVISTLKENNIPCEIWTLNTAQDIENLDKYISGVTSDILVAEKVLYDANID